MAEPDSDRAWDEYEWERFLQQQDKRTEKYMELLEKYIDDPNRDEIVAREMGWCNALEETGNEWQEEEFEEDEETQSAADIINGCAESFEQHVLYRAAFNLTIWIDQLFDETRRAAKRTCGSETRHARRARQRETRRRLSDEDVRRNQA